MSGTSLDGLDIAFCQFNYTNNTWEFKIEKAAEIKYDDHYRNTLKSLIEAPSHKILQFHNIYGSWLGKQVNTFLSCTQLKPDFISSHGHTIFHQPESGFTYQLGSGQHLANETGFPVVCDFRTGDVALGGQGAPLVPIGDQLLFSEYDFCLNLGGISNMSFSRNKERIAYDISPVNMLLSYITRKINLEYDHNGLLASKGVLNSNLLEELNEIDYYHQSYPKSLGYEWFVKEVIPIINRNEDSIENLLHTSVIHISEQISANIKKHSNPKISQKLVATGGGAKNGFLIKSLKEKLRDHITIQVPNHSLIDYKEALIFAFMGVLRMRNEVNCLKSVTGASKDSSSGVIYYPL